MRVVLLTPSRRFIANRYGVGYQIPLGLVFLGGPLSDAGHCVRLIDNDLYGWNSRRLITELVSFHPDCILLGHTGSTAAHTTCLATATALRAAFPYVRIAYGGVYPSYAAETVLCDCPAIDVIVRGEAEQTVLELTAAWERGSSLAEIPGLAWRAQDRILLNRTRPALQNLDAYRPGWELVDWPRYSLFGVGRSAGMQFSRGCPLTCTYCGQWLFWKRWRHRSPQNVVDELTILARRYAVRIVWFADENFGGDREALVELLTLLIEADLGLSLNVNMTAAGIVANADLLPQMKAAGVDYVVMGVESLEDPVVASVRKNNPFAVSREAVALLRQSRIISLVNIIYGLEDETRTTVHTKLSKLRLLDADLLNAVYITPHFWTEAGRKTDPHEIIQTDTALWTYRNQVLRTPHLSSEALFWSVKSTEALFHLRLAGLLRLVYGGDARIRKILRASILVGLRVVLAEIAEFALATRFSRPGALRELPGVPAVAPAEAVDAIPLVSSDIG